MKNNEGTGDIVRFLYDEMCREESQDFEEQLRYNADAREELEDLREVQDELDRLRCSPSAGLLESIMRYARQGNPSNKPAVSKGIA